MKNYVASFKRRRHLMNADANVYWNYSIISRVAKRSEMICHWHRFLILLFAADVRQLLVISQLAAACARVTQSTRRAYFYHVWPKRFRQQSRRFTWQLPASENRVSHTTWHGVFSARDKSMRLECDFSLGERWPKRPQTKPRSDATCEGKIIIIRLKYRSPASSSLIAYFFLALETRVGDVLKRQQT